MYIEGPPPLYISYISPEQTRQDRYQETLKTAGDKCQRIKKVTKVNKSKQCMEAASIGTSTMPLKCFHHVLRL